MYATKIHPTDHIGHFPEGQLQQIDTTLFYDKATQRLFQVFEEYTLEIAFKM